MEWIKFDDAIDKGKYLVCTDTGIVTEMSYTWNSLAKTERGRAPRWEWHGRLSPWTITHYMPLPAPPTE